MCEVTSDNFNDLYPEIESALKQSQFITVDLEFSALNPITKSANSLFNTAEEMYEKLSRNMQHSIPLQIGLTAFDFDPEMNVYKGKVYTFYLFPKSLGRMEKYFVCQPSSLQFLSQHDFDFNKCFYKGVSFINRNQEENLRQLIKSSSFEIDSKIELENLCTKYFPVISEWLLRGKEDAFVIPDVFLRYKYNYEFMHKLHKEVRLCFSGKAWTFIEGENFVVKKVTQKEFVVLSHSDNLDEELMNNLMGFTRVYRLLAALKRPIIGHNLLLDLIMMTNNFEEPLPKHYKTFKKSVFKQFPTVFDTKTINFELRRLLPEDKQWESGSLQSLYSYFKDGKGRHLAQQAPIIEVDGSAEHEKFHNAGWDSYYTGYIFIRMAHIFLSQKCEKSQKFNASALITSMAEYKNCINIIKGSLSYIRLDGEDPISRRPPRLIIQSVGKKPIDINHAVSLLGSYGYVEVKPFSVRGDRAIVAVDNFGNARRILQHFRSNPEFRIETYNAWKHSPLARAFLWGRVVISGAVLVWTVKAILS